jgi:hypothetical protein
VSPELVHSHDSALELIQDYLNDLLEHDSSYDSVDSDPARDSDSSIGEIVPTLYPSTQNIGYSDHVESGSATATCAMELPAPVTTDPLAIGEATPHTSAHSAHASSRAVSATTGPFAEVDAEVLDIFSDADLRLSKHDWAKRLKHISLTPVQYERAKVLRRKIKSRKYAGDNRKKKAQETAAVAAENVQLKRKNKELVAYNKELVAENKRILADLEKLKQLVSPPDR